MAAGADPPPVVAIVNGQAIPRASLERRMAQSRSMNAERFDGMRPEEKRQAISRVLSAMVMQELKYQEALRQQIVVPAEEIERKLAEAQKGFASYREFEKSLANGQITVAEWKEETRKARMIAKLEEKAAAGMPHAKWLDQRPAWVNALVAKAQIWIWQP